MNTKEVYKYYVRISISIITNNLIKNYKIKRGMQ